MCIRDRQYSKYEPVKGTFVNGQFTNGENIADLGGVAIAYDALQMYLKDKGNPGLISGYNQDQRFFLSWGTIWRTKSTEKYMINQVKTDPHSPGLFRAFGPVSYTHLDVYKRQEKRTPERAANKMASGLANCLFSDHCILC